MTSPRSGSQAFISSNEVVDALLSLHKIEEKKSDVKERTVLSQMTFDCVVLHDEEKTPQKPRKILVLDVDDTLIDHKQSKATQKIIFLHLEKLKQKILYARQNNVMLVIATSRHYVPKSTYFLSVDNILKELGIEHFSMIFYTKGNSKSPVLGFLWDAYFDFNEGCMDQICLVDDNDRFLNDLTGFQGIKVNSSSDAHLDLMQDFVDNKPLPKVGIEEEFENVLEEDNKRLGFN